MIQDDEHLLAVLRYMEANPVRAEMARYQTKLRQLESFVMSVPLYLDHHVKAASTEGIRARVVS